MSRRKILRRLSVGLVDQVVSSGSNFAATLIAARWLDRAGFGVFSVGMVLALVAVGLSKAMCTEALLVRPGDDPDGRSARASAALGSAVSLGAVLSGTFFIGSAVLNGPLASCLAVVAVLTPFVVLQDTYRMVAFSNQRPSRALVSDLLWVVLMAVGFIVARKFRLSPASLIAAWMMAGALAGVATIAHARLAPAVRSGFAWVSENRDLSVPYALTFVSTQGAGYFSSLILAATAGVTAAGGVRGAIALFGPLNILAIGAYVSLVPEGLRLAERSPTRLLHLCKVAGIGLSAWAAMVTVFFLVLPDSAGEAILGSTWLGSRELVPYVGVAAVASGAIAGALVGLSALTEASRILRARLITMPATLGLPALGGIFAGGRGLAIGLAIANWIAVVVMWRDLSHAAAARADQIANQSESSQQTGKDRTDQSGALN
ncbi:MAG: hypothetical protein ABIP03_03125 [Aquihabitans sp.]